MAMAKFRAAGAMVEVIGMNAASATIVDRLGQKQTAHPGEVIAPH